MSKLATTTGNKNCVAVHLLHQRLKRVLRHYGGLLSMAMFSSGFQPPKPALNLAGCCHLRPIHISELLQLTSRS